jgi:hypothetical protein
MNIGRYITDRQTKSLISSTKAFFDDFIKLLPRFTVIYMPVLIPHSTTCWIPSKLQFVTVYMQLNAVADRNATSVYGVRYDANGKVAR